MISDSRYGDHISQVLRSFIGCRLLDITQEDADDPEPFVRFFFDNGQEIQVPSVSAFSMNCGDRDAP